MVLSVTEQDAGRYDCKVGGNIVCSYNITVDAHRCSAPARSNDYQKVYSDWCHEFEKYKMAMKSWERKQAQCLNRSNASTPNAHANDIYQRPKSFLWGTPSALSPAGGRANLVSLDVFLICSLLLLVFRRLYMMH